MYRVLSIFAAALLILTLAIGGKNFYFEIFAEEPAATEIETEPMIDKEAVEAYKNGEISKLTAIKRIDRRLNLLTEAGYIRSWVFIPESFKYEVVLNSEAVFSYCLN